MAIEANLRALLLADGTIAGLVGSKIYPAPLESARPAPCITYFRIDTPGQYTHDGGRNPVHPRIQFDLWGTNYPNTIALYNAFIVVLGGYSGIAGSGGSAANVQAAFIADARDDYDPDTQRYRKIVDVLVWHNE